MLAFGDDYCAYYVGLLEKAILTKQIKITTVQFLKFLYFKTSG